MKLDELLKFITDNASALGVIIPFIGLIGAVIGFFLKMILEHFSKSADKKSKIIAELKVEVSNLQSKNDELHNELDKYTLVKKSPEGDVLIQIETSTTICPICWNKDKNAIPVFDNGRGKYKCTICGHSGIYSFSAAEEAKQKEIDSINAMTAMNQRRAQEFNKKGWFN